MDIMKSVIAMVEERDHKRFLVNAGEDLAEEIWS